MNTDGRFQTYITHILYMYSNLTIHTSANWLTSEYRFQIPNLYYTHIIHMYKNHTIVDLSKLVNQWIQMADSGPLLHIYYICTVILPLYTSANWLTSEYRCQIPNLYYTYIIHMYKNHTIVDLSKLVNQWIQMADSGPFVQHVLDSFLEIINIQLEHVVHSYHWS